MNPKSPEQPARACWTDDLRKSLSSDIRSLRSTQGSCTGRQKSQVSGEKSAGEVAKEAFSWSCNYGLEATP